MKRKIGKEAITKRKIFIGVIVALAFLLIMLLVLTLSPQNQSKKSSNNFTIEISETNTTNSSTYQQNVSEESQEIVRIRKPGRVEIIP